MTEQPSAYLVPRLLTFKGAVRTSCPPEFQDEIEGTVAWGPSLIGDAHPVTDKHGVTHKVIPLFPHNDKLAAIVKAFVEKHEICCPEAISQVDSVIMDAYDFIEDLVEVVGYYNHPEEEDV